MRILGIVAEYDPFHLGHLSHLTRSRQAAEADLTYIALSGCVRQRGDWALLPPRERAACAVLAGADAVFELPLLWTVREAENYALGAVSLLASLGCTHLAFGAERDDLPLLAQLADHLEASPSAFRDALKLHLAAGRGYPSAVAAAAAETLPEAAGVLEEPNNILAVCYLRAIRRLGAALSPVLIHRIGAYHAAGIDPVSPSASALRGALLRGNYGPAYAAMPDYAVRFLRCRFMDGSLPDTAAADALLMSRLRDPAYEKSLLPFLSEGLEDALSDAASVSGSRREILERLTSRRYASARISRLCACALLGITAEQAESAPLPQSAGLLAFRRNPEMTARWKDLPVPVLSSPLLWRESADYGPNLAAYRMDTLLRHLPDTLPFSEKMFVL